MKEKITNNKYVFNILENKKVKIVNGGDLDFDNMNKGYFDDIETRDKKIKKLKNSLAETKSWAIKESVYSNLEIPQVWKNKMEYQNDVMKIISKDNKFFSYLSKSNTNRTVNVNVNINKPTNVDTPREDRNYFSDKPLMNYIDNNTPHKNKYKRELNVETTHNINTLYEDEGENNSTKRSRINPQINSRVSRNFIKHENKIYSEKEKRDILDHFRDLYKVKKKTLNSGNGKIQDGKIVSKLPIINKQTKLNLTARENQNHLNLTDLPMNSTQKCQMFKSSIYNLLLPDHTNTGNSLFESKNDSISISSSNNKISKGMKTSRTFGPFLNFDYAEYNKKIEIKNPEIKKVLEDIDFYGPYFSHCPSCRNKNLEFYKNMDSHNCLRILNFIKKSKIKNLLTNSEDNIDQMENLQNINDDTL